MKPGLRHWPLALALALALATALPVSLDARRGLVDARASAVELFGWMDSDESEASEAAAPADRSETATVARFPDFAELAERVSPAVVNIRTSRAIEPSAGPPPAPTRVRGVFR